MTTISGDDDQYQACLRTRNTEEQTKAFDNFNEAILWLSKEFEAGDGYAEYGEVRHRGRLLWRRRGG